MRTVPVAAADHVAPLCRGPARPATVSAVFSGALVLDCPSDHRGQARTVVLLARRATAVPVGIRTVEPLPRAAVGTPVQLGEGGVTMPGTAFRLARTWPSTVPPIHPDPGRLAELASRVALAPLGMDRNRLAVLAAVLADSPAGTPATPLGEAVHARRIDRRTAAADDLARAVHDLVGRGAGATPAGDDVLAGAMVGLWARGRPDSAGRLADAVDPSRTTPYSAALLAAAAAGHAVLEALAVLRWLHSPRPPWTRRPASHPVDRLLAVGHTSGADLAAGLLLGLRIGTAAAGNTVPAGDSVPAADGSAVA